jgi:chromosome segregation ATPase
MYFFKGHHNLLKEHLQKATAEKAQLEENAAELGEKAEKLKYELAEAHEAAHSRDKVIALLEDQLNHLETMYTQSLEESHMYRLRLGNLEQELKHLKEVCCKVS